MGWVGIEYNIDIFCIHFNLSDLKYGLNFFSEFIHLYYFKIIINNFIYFTY